MIAGAEGDLPEAAVTVGVEAVTVGAEGVIVGVEVDQVKEEEVVVEAVVDVEGVVEVIGEVVGVLEVEVGVEAKFNVEAMLPQPGPVSAQSLAEVVAWVVKPPPTTTRTT